MSSKLEPKFVWDERTSNLEWTALLYGNEGAWIMDIVRMGRRDGWIFYYYQDDAARPYVVKEIPQKELDVTNRTSVNLMSYAVECYMRREYEQLKE